MRPGANDGLIERRCDSVDDEAVGESSSGEPGPGPGAQPVPRPWGPGALTWGPGGTPARLLLSPAEAAWALGVGRTTMYRLLAEGTVVSVRVGSLRRVPLAALEAYVAGLPTTSRVPG